MTTQATQAAEQSQDSANQDSKRQTNKQTGKLDKRYGEIGISAVAAALRHNGEQQSVSEYRIPYDRD